MGQSGQSYEWMNKYSGSNTRVSFYFIFQFLPTNRVIITEQGRSNIAREYVRFIFDNLVKLLTSFRWAAKKFIIFFYFSFFCYKSSMLSNVPHIGFAQQIVLSPIVYTS